MKKHISFLLTRSLLLTLAMVGLAGAEDTPQLQQINHSILSPNSEQIVLKLSGSYSPKTFTLKDQSPRVVFDFADMTQAKGVRNLVTTNGPLLKGIRVGVHQEDEPKTRVVVDLKSLKGVNYTQQFDEKTSTLTIRFTGPEKKVVKEAPPTPTPAPTDQVAEAAIPATDAPPVSEQPAAPPVAPETIPPPPPVTEPVAKEAPPAAKEGKAGKKAEKTAPPAPATDTKGLTTTTADTPPPSPAPPPAVATTPAESQIPAVIPPPPQPTTAATGPAATESAPPVTKEPPPVPVKESKGVKKEEAKTTEDKTAPAKEQSAATESKPAPPAAQAPAEVKQPADQTPPVLAAAANAEPELESIKFDPSSPKGEMIMFKLNGFHPPAVHGVEEGIPRVICDFNNTKLGSATKKQIKTNGQHVKVIRTSVTKKPEKVRVVIDLEPNRSYDLQQVFFKDDNLFVIIVNTIGK